ncbi:MAG: hypothetical protein KJ706_07675 [Candidatus Omnitrophica bacterium]|nr:hypothetical protein [Candidatus Omnitrophota bacterium]MBU4590680.1 hypothetical protein [Candidatus Omnitrophota bacterium]
MIDVIVTSICRKQFETTYASFMKNVRYDKGFRFIIHIDVLEKNKSYLPRLLEFLKYNRISDININKERHTFANAVNHLFKNLQSEYYFHLEDDWVFLKPIDLTAIIRVMKDNENIHNIRFSKQEIKRPSNRMKKNLARRNELYLLPGEEIYIDGLDLIKSNIWSLNPHVARTSVIKRFADIPVDINPESFLSRRYFEKFSQPGLYIYGKYGDPPCVSDIGRPCYIIKKAQTIIEIIKDPSLIKRENRIKKLERYMGKPFKH